jgi:hypothetical protein
MEITSVWYLKQALAAVEKGHAMDCEHALRGFAAAEVDLLGFKKIYLERGQEYIDTEKEERHQLLVAINEAIARRIAGQKKENRTRYQLTGKVAIREADGPDEIVKDHTETVEASSPVEAIEVSLSGFTEEEEACWQPGYPLVTLLNEGEAR